MWIASNLGYFSIVKKEGQFYVRARSVQDLKDLKAATGLRNKIKQWKGTDYIARIILDESELNKVRDALFAGITYDNFKDSIKDNPRQREKTGFYGKVWNIMFDYQWRKSGSNFGKRVGKGWQYGQLLPLRDDSDNPNNKDIPF